MGVELTVMVIVICLLAVAAALATPKGCVPLALRGVLRVLKKDQGSKTSLPPVAPVPVWRKIVAFLLVVLAALLALA